MDHVTNGSKVDVAFRAVPYFNSFLLFLGQYGLSWIARKGDRDSGIKTIHRQDNSPTVFLRQFTDRF